MIIVVCTDDPSLIQIAQESIIANPGIFGNLYQIYQGLIPQLGVNENLFVIAHGAYQGDDGNPVIGSEANAFYVNAVDFYTNISNLIPAGYNGNVYIDACEAANHNASTFSFIEVFQTQIQVDHGNVRVFGRNGKVGGMIPLPNSSGWTQAAWTHTIEGDNSMITLSSEALRRAKKSVDYAEQTFEQAGERTATDRIYNFFGITPTSVATNTRLMLAATTPSSSDLNALLNNVGTAPGASTVVTVPATPVSGDVALIQNVQTLDSYIATLTALVMYNNHPTPYNLSDKKDAAQFVIDLANARNFVVTGGTVKAIPMYLPMGEATTQSFNKETVSANLHIDLLDALFGALGLPSAVLTELDGILTEIANSLKNLELSFTTQTQTLNHFVSFYYLVQVPGTNTPVNLMNVEFIYIQLNQSSWETTVSLGKNSGTVSHFTLDMTTTRTTSTMSAGVVAANTSNIVNSLMALTSKDATTISDMTGMKGVKT